MTRSRVLAVSYSAITVIGLTLFAHYVIEPVAAGTAFVVFTCFVAGWYGGARTVKRRMGTSIRTHGKDTP